MDANNINTAYFHLTGDMKEKFIELIGWGARLAERPELASKPLEMLGDLLAMHEIHMNYCTHRLGNYATQPERDTSELAKLFNSYCDLINGICQTARAKHLYFRAPNFKVLLDKGQDHQTITQVEVKFADGFSLLVPWGRTDEEYDILGPEHAKKELKGLDEKMPDLFANILKPNSSRLMGARKA
jgi:hypothetical protein